MRKGRRGATSGQDKKAQPVLSQARKPSALAHALYGHFQSFAVLFLSFATEEEVVMGIGIRFRSKAMQLAYA